MTDEIKPTVPDVNEQYPQGYSFWKYDQFPYLLGGPVKERSFVMGIGWKVSTHNFGGHSFSEVANFPYAVGAVLKKELEDLEKARKDLIEQVDAECDAKRTKLFKKYGLTP